MKAAGLLLIFCVSQAAWAGPWSECLSLIPEPGKLARVPLEIPGRAEVERAMTQALDRHLGDDGLLSKTSLRAEAAEGKIDFSLGATAELVVKNVAIPAGAGGTRPVRAEHGRWT